MTSYVILASKYHIICVTFVTPVKFFGVLGCWNVSSIMKGESWGCHGSDYKHYCLLECDVRRQWSEFTEVWTICWYGQ
jgi:hypothetical protein